MSGDDHISQIRTVWSVVRRAHSDHSVEARNAQHAMLERYGGAIRRYLLGAFRDQSAADDAYQEFALRFLNGDYRSADPEKGKFRSFLKTILYRLVIEHHRGNKRRKTPQMNSECPEPAVLDPSISDENFQKLWRDEMLQRAWDGLKAIEDQSGRPLFTVMRIRADAPDMSSTDLATQLSDLLNRNVTSANVRVMLHRSRDEFAKLLFKEVAETIDNPTREMLEEELIDLGLLEYCRSVLQRMNGAT